MVAVGWTSPLSHSATVNITGSIASADPNGCASKFTWSLEDQSGSSLQSGGARRQSDRRLPGRAGRAAASTWSLDTNGIPVAYDAECATATATLHITAAETTGPHVTLDSPANGSLISGAQPSFAGAASTAFGASPTVTVRIYRGPTATGTPVQTLTRTRNAERRIHGRSQRGSDRRPVHRAGRAGRSVESAGRRAQRPLDLHRAQRRPR